MPINLSCENSDTNISLPPHPYYFEKSICYLLTKDNEYNLLIACQLTHIFMLLAQLCISASEHKQTKGSDVKHFILKNL